TQASELILLAPTTEQGATAMIEKLIGYGVSYIRTHVNIDPYVELQNFWGVKRALEKYAHVIDYDIVDLPQHGLLKNPQTLL
ncbi:amidohydrolase, partial [Enterococcus faecalis]